MTLTTTTRRTTLPLAAAAASLLVLSACGSDGGSAGGNYPAQPINLNAPAEPGSGWDTTARAMAQAIDEEGLIDVPLPVQNQPGGMGCSWLTQMTGKSGEDGDIAVTSLASQTMNERGLCELGPLDVTMIATLYTENFVVVTSENSDIESFSDVIDVLSEDPGSMPIAAAGDDRLPLALLLDDADIPVEDVRFVDYEGGGEQATALMNGDAAVAIAGLSEFLSPLQSGELSALVSFAPEPMEAPFDEVPTAIEEGYDVTLANWRGVYGPPEMPQEAVDYWADVLAEMVETESWQELAQNNHWSPEFNVGEELDAYVTDAQETVAEGVADAGIEG